MGSTTLGTGLDRSILSVLGYIFFIFFERFEKKTFAPNILAHSLGRACSQSI
jgi:hypothetical protein